jgi:hypothetical protein
MEKSLTRLIMGGGFHPRLLHHLFESRHFGPKILELERARLVRPSGTSKEKRAMIREGRCWCPGYRGIPVHLLLGPFNGPALAQGWNDDQSPAEKTLMRRRLMRRTTAKTAKD